MRCRSNRHISRLELLDIGQVNLRFAQNELEARVAHTPVGRICLPKFWDLYAVRSHNEVNVAAVAFTDPFNRRALGATVGSSN